MWVYVNEDRNNNGIISIRQLKKKQPFKVLIEKLWNDIVKC